MRGSLVRRCGAAVAVLALPVLLIAPASAASSSSKLASATLNGERLDLPVRRSSR